MTDGYFRRICTYPGCINAQHGPRCALHPYPPESDRRESSTKRGYDRHWRALRSAYLERNLFCEIRHECDGRPAVLVDHIIPISKGGQTLDWNNLQSSCRPCHDWKTAVIDKVRQEK